jgi:glycosyltransferase involved in cell wall biosynthesis
MDLTKMDAAKISVIIPIKNRASLIQQTLNSILAQTYQFIEIIIVDDHSTDALEAALIPYKEVIVYIKSNGRGPGAARNTGFEIATGDYIKFFDSDDLMSPTALFDQICMLKASKKKFVTSPYFYALNQENNWLSQKNEILNYYHFSSRSSLQHCMIWGLFIPIPSMLFSKTFLHEIGQWPEDITTSEDWIYLWRIAEKEPQPSHVNSCAFIYRMHQQQSTAGNMDDLSRDKEKYKILIEVYHTYIRTGDFSWLERAIFRSKFYQMAMISKDPVFKKQLLKTAGKGMYGVQLYVKIKMKVGRIITKSDWQPMHGITKDHTIVKTYLNWFN